MTTIAQHAAVHDLLQRARNAHDGADLAREAMNTDAATELSAKARRLLQDAQAVDPAHESGAWAAMMDFLNEMAEL